MALPGQIFTRVENERIARKMAEEAKEEARKQNIRRREKVTLESIFSSSQKETKTLHVVLRADTQGTLRAISDVLASIGEEEVKVEVVSQGVGEVRKSDVLLASSSEAIILAFNSEVTPEVESLASQQGVEIRQYQVLYDIIDDIKQAVKGMLEPVYVEEVAGRAEVRQIFNIPRIGIVAGCYVMEGKVIRGAKVKILRREEVVGEGTVVSLKRFEKDVNEISVGLECGVKIEGSDNIQKGDIIEVYQQKRIR
ncbi:hypothetical protein H5U35_02520 [Candidatus Aerophobetes bacterium]|nr:hypothetical protein [Candidatus Aerophobetes bacterium]